MNLQDRLNEIVTNKRLYATEGASFGPLLGSELTFPKQPEYWTLSQLEALQKQQIQVKKGRTSEAFTKMWDRVMTCRRRELGADYALNYNVFSPPSGAVLAEFLELEPEVARPALAAAACFNNPDLGLAGHDLYWACDALVNASTQKGSMPHRCILPPKEPLDASNIHKLVEKGDNAVDWPLDIRVVRQAKTKYLVFPGKLGEVCKAFQGLTHFWVLGQAGIQALEHFLEALLTFFRQSLLARVTIGVALPTTYALSMDSRPVEGVIVKESSIAFELMSLKEDAVGELSLTRHNVMPHHMSRVSLPQDDSHRLALVEHLLRLWACPYRDYPALLNYEVHLRYVAPFAEVKTALSASEKDELLALAAQTYEVVATHVKKGDDGLYHVTRHDLVFPFPLAITDDVEFAIGLALVHEVEFRFHLSLACGGR